MRRSFHLVRILILYILLEYNHGFSRDGCLTNVSTIEVKNKRSGKDIAKKIKLLEPHHEHLPAQKNIKTLEACQHKCSSSTDTCYIMMFIHDYEECYIGGAEDFIFQPEREHPTNYTSYINLCGHRNSDLDEGDCYYKVTVKYYQSGNIPQKFISVDECEKLCDNSSSCYGFRHYNHGGTDTCEPYVQDYYGIKLEYDKDKERTYHFKKCDTCLNHNCKHGGTCVPTIGTCCNYTCSCTDVNMVGDCDRCKIGLGIDKGKCKSCGKFAIGNGKDCIDCDAGMVANSDNTECDVISTTVEVASTTCSTPNTTWTHEGTTSAGNEDFPPWIKYKWHLTTVAINVVVLYGGLFGLWYWYNSIYHEICQYVDERIDKIQERASARSSTKTDTQEPGYNDAGEEDNPGEQGEEGGGEEN